MIRLVKTDRKINFTGVTPALVAGATLFFVAILVAYFYSQQKDIEFKPCLFKQVTHQHCFLCGGTRASVSLASGNLWAAIKFNPLVTLLLCYLAFSILLKFVFRRKFTTTGLAIKPGFRWIFAISLVITNWIYVLRYLEH